MHRKKTILFGAVVVLLAFMVFSGAYIATRYFKDSKNLSGNTESTDFPAPPKEKEVIFSSQTEGVATE